MKISQYMSRPVATIAPATTLRQALDEMRIRGIHHLPVSDGEALVGIVAEHDLLLAVANFGNAEVPVGEIMKHPVTCISVRGSVQQAARLLIARRIGGLPVLDARKRLAGIITETDIFKIMAGLRDEAPRPKKAARRAAPARKAPARARRR